MQSLQPPVWERLRSIHYCSASDGGGFRLSEQTTISIGTFEGDQASIGLGTREDSHPAGRSQSFKERATCAGP